MKIKITSFKRKKKVKRKINKNKFQRKAKKNRKE